MRTNGRTSVSAVLFALFATCSCALLSSSVGAHSGHLGSDLSLEISIKEDGVRYEIAGFGTLFPGMPSDAEDLILDESKLQYSFATPEETARMRQDLLSEFSDPNPVTIDGIRVKPILERCEFAPNSSPEAFAAPEIFPPEVLLVLHYPAKGAPKQVKLAWTTFMEEPNKLLTGDKPSTLFAMLRAFDKKKVLRFTSTEPEYVWHAPTASAGEQLSPAIVEVPPATWQVPLLAWGSLLLGLVALGVSAFVPRGKARWGTLGLVVALPTVGFAALPHVAVVSMPAIWRSAPPLPDQAQATQLFETLQRNVYRAFDYTKESDVYDVLVQSVDGPLLDRIYREVFESLIMRDEGGAVAQVQAVDILDSQLLSAGAISESESIAFEIAARWRVHGVVTHWGHAHERTNEYRATYTVAQRGDQWKIVGVSDLDQERVESEEASDS